MDPDSSRLIAQINLPPATIEAVIALFAAFILLLLSGFASVSEAAYTLLKPEDIDETEEEDESCKKVGLLLKKADHVLASLSIFNNILKIAFVVSAAYGLSLLADHRHAPGYFYVLFLFVILFFVLLPGIVLPKIIAHRSPLKIAKSSAGFLRLLTAVCKPFSSVMVTFSLYSDHYKRKRVHDLSVDELSKALELTSGEIKDEKEILEGIIRFHDKTVVQIMTSRIDIFALDIQKTFKEVIKDIVDAGYSRVPVYSESLDSVKGVLYIKDLLPYIDKPDSFRWQNLIRRAFFIPETKKIDDLLEEFRNNKTHLAIVVNEFGELSGVVSLEDVLEEIVGEISDEYDEEDSRFQKMPDGSYLFEAKTLLTDFFKITGINPDEFGNLISDVETLAGLVLEIKGSFPELNEVVDYKKYSFQVLEMNRRRIQKVKLLIAGEVPATV